MSYFGHIMRKHGDCLEKEIMQGTVPGARARGRPRKRWMDNMGEWSGLSTEKLLRGTEDRSGWKRIVYNATMHVTLVPRTVEERERERERDYLISLTIEDFSTIPALSK